MRSSNWFFLIGVIVSVLSNVAFATPGAAFEAGAGFSTGQLVRMVSSMLLAIGLAYVGWMTLTAFSSVVRGQMSVGDGLWVMLRGSVTALLLSVLVNSLI